LPHAVADRIDAARNFMTWYTGILNSRPETVLDQYIAVANATRFHFYADLAGPWFGNVAFN
jgi:hypothetical protein